MQAILVVRIFDFSGVIKAKGAQRGADMVYELRNMAEYFMTGSVYADFNELICAVFPSVREALSKGTKLIQKLSLSEGIPLCGAIGYGQLYQTADGNYWGLECNRAISISDNSSLKEIRLTEAAQEQLSIPSIKQCK